MLADFQSFCPPLEIFGLPRAIANLGSDRFIAWNKEFVERLGFTADQMGTISLKERLTFGPLVQHVSLDEDDFPIKVELTSCSILGALETEIVHGRVAKRQDDFAYLMLDPLDPGSDSFARGQILGQDQERKRILRVLHDALSPHLLVAMFTVRGVQEKIETKDGEAAAQLRLAMDALEKAFARIADAI
jgi:signal transduction histidine kinase